MRTLGFLSILMATSGVALANDQSTVVDFETGALGWSGPAGIGGGTQIEPGAGNPGAGLRTVFNNFGITFSSGPNPAFAGDFSPFDSVTLSVDLLVNEIAFFGQPAPRPWLVELRDFDSAQGGFPYTSVWYLFGNVTADPNWTTYSVTIDDTSSSTLPTGWAGYGAEDPVTFEPILPAGVTFADVLAGVDEVVYTTLQPGFFFGFTDFDVVLDNITITTEGGPWCSIGSGIVGTGGAPNLAGYGLVEPGAPSNVFLYGAAPAAPAFLAIGASEIALPLLGGTLFSSAELAVISGVTNGAGLLPFNFTWPAGLTPGVELVWQYGILDAAAPQAVALSNGLKSVAP